MNMNNFIKLLLIILFWILVIVWIPLTLYPFKFWGLGDWFSLITMIVGYFTLFKWGYEKIQKLT